MTNKKRITKLGRVPAITTNSFNGRKNSVKPSSYAPYKNPARNIITFHTSTPFFLRVQSPKFDLLGAEEEY